MKNKTKLVVALASLLAVTGGVGAYSTFAWFTVNHVASITVSEVSADSKTGDLKIRVSSVDYGGTDVTSDTTDVTTKSFNNNLALTDVSSGTGLTFYKPVYDLTSATEGTIASYDNINSNPTDNTSLRYFMEFQVTFKNYGTAPIDVYLNGGSNFTSTDHGAQNAFRMSIIDTTGTPASSLVWQPGEEVAAGATNATTNHKSFLTAGAEDKYAFISNVSGTTATYSAETNIVANHTILGTALTTVTTAADATAAAAQKFLTLTAGTPTTAITKTLNFRVWMEGSSTWCWNSIKGEKSVLSLKFFGI